MKPPSYLSAPFHNLAEAVCIVSPEALTLYSLSSSNCPDNRCKKDLPMDREASCILGFCEKSFVCLTLAAILGILTGCGSGGSDGQSPAPAPDFAISLSSSSLTIAGGIATPITASVVGSKGFASPVTLQITGLPTGVTFSPSSLQVNAGSPLQITLAAASTVSPSTANVLVTGNSGSLTHSVQLNLTVIAAPVNPAVFRTRYIRTDAVTEYYLEVNLGWMVYDAPTNRFFVSDPDGNQIVVIDAGKEAKIATISVPGAFGIDEAPDHSVLYAGTEIGDVYEINPTTMKITHRYVAAQIGSSGFHAASVRVLANGELALLGSEAAGPFEFGFPNVAVWNPATMPWRFTVDQALTG